MRPWQALVGVALAVVVMGACRGEPEGGAKVPPEQPALAVSIRVIDFTQLVFEVTVTNRSSQPRAVDLSPVAFVATDDRGNTYRLYPDPNRDYCDYRPDVLVREQLPTDGQATGCLILYGEVPDGAAQLTLRVEPSGGDSLGPWTISRP